MAGTINRCGRGSWRRDDLIASGLAIILPGFAVTWAASCSSADSAASISTASIASSARSLVSVANRSKIVVARN